MSYCHGSLEKAEPGSSGGARNVTGCSDRKLLFAFDPTEAWHDGVSHGPNLEWPRVISDDFHAFRLTTRSMAVMYIIGVGAVGSALVAKVVSLTAPRRQQGLFEFGFLVVSIEKFSGPCRSFLAFGKNKQYEQISNPTNICRSAWVPESECGLHYRNSRCFRVRRPHQCSW